MEGGKQRGIQENEASTVLGVTQATGFIDIALEKMMQKAGKCTNVRFAK